MESLAVARVLHVLGVVLWIGGVAMVTAVLLPAVQRFKTPEERVVFFEEIERRFAAQSRATTLVVGASGFYLVYELDLWWRLARPEFWWMHAMIIIWVIFTLMLFVFEPLFLHRWFIERAQRAPDATFGLVAHLHWVLMTLSLVAVAGAVAGSHGYLLP